MATLLNHSISAPGKRKELLTGVVVLGASGAIASQVCEGFTVAKTATKTGRYTATLAKQYTTIEYAHCVQEISADTAAVQAKGVLMCLRGVSASGKVALFQATLAPTAAAAGADAEPADSVTLRIMIVAKRGML
jgi:hypothetical protein